MAFHRRTLVQLRNFFKRFHYWPQIIVIAFIVILASSVTDTFQLVNKHDEISNRIQVNESPPRTDDEDLKYLGSNTIQADGMKTINDIRILCVVLTMKNKFKSNALTVKETWGKRCDELVFMSSDSDSELPAVQLLVREAQDVVWGKVREAYRYAWNNYKNKADWFLRVDDDTFVVVENLRYFLSGYDTAKPYWFGHRSQDENKTAYLNSRPGYVLSREATRRFAEEGYFSDLLCRHDHVGKEDEEMKKCMQNLNVTTMDTRDSKGRERFIPFSPESYMFLDSVRNENDLKSFYYPNQKGLDCCSDSAISFSRLSSKEMNLLELFTYQIRPYGIEPEDRPLTPEPPPDYELTATPWNFPKNLTTLSSTTESTLISGNSTALNETEKWNSTVKSSK